jgi:hypothetical protein
MEVHDDLSESAWCSSLAADGTVIVDLSSRAPYVEPMDLMMGLVQPTHRPLPSRISSQW